MVPLGTKPWGDSVVRSDHGNSPLSRAEQTPDPTQLQHHVLRSLLSPLLFCLQTCLFEGGNTSSLTSLPADGAGTAGHLRQEASGYNGTYPSALHPNNSQSHPQPRHHVSIIPTDGDWPLMSVQCLQLQRWDL